MFERIEKLFRSMLPAADFCSLRLVRERDQILTVRQDIPQPVEPSENLGAMITVVDGGGLGYAATSDLSEAGLRQAIQRAQQWAQQTAGRCVIDYRAVNLPHPVGQYLGPNKTPWESVSLRDKFDLLRAQSRALKIDDRIVDWEASLWHTDVECLYLTSGGGRVQQQFSYFVPGMHAVANEKDQTQQRSFGGLRENSRQGGMEVLQQVGFLADPRHVAEEALELLAAPNCPSGKMDLLLERDQMILQIHESVGHPVELDRILGDERNYAGTSFVTPDMFGSYQYGSKLMNITYDPTRPGQFASFGFDDEGAAAHKEFIIRDGVLQRPLGGLTSQTRAGMPGVANARACSWNRPPIDRMANLNLEIGDSTLEAMIASVAHGVYMKTNCSWSIDDSRNKFQFGCEWARLIEDGRLTKVVKNPNYRGISATFWRNLKAVGNESTFQVMGTPFCGKGEPNQMIRVGHASPAALFADVDVFGGA